MTTLAKSVLAAVVAAMLAPSAQAHGIWIAQRHGDQAIIYGHGATDEVYDPAKITELRPMTPPLHLSLSSGKRPTIMP